MIESDFDHEHSFVPGLHLKFNGLTFHVNPGIIFNVIEQKPTLILCAGSWNMPSVWLALLAARLARVPCMFWSEGHSSAVRHSGGWIAALRRFVLRRFDGFTVPNKTSAEWIVSQRGPGAQCILLPNTVDDSYYLRNDDGARACARHILGLPDDLLIIVQVSQLEPHKGVVQLAKAYLELESQAATPTLMAFVGEGSMRSELVALSKATPKDKQVIVTGHLERQHVRLWLMAADAFALNTFRDPNPLAPIEASFAALPLLLSVRAGNHSELVNGETGYTIDDCESPGPALARLVATPIAGLRRMGFMARLRAQNGFERTMIAGQLLNELEKLQFAHVSHD